jgi:hypothetical protein
MLTMAWAIISDVPFLGQQQGTRSLDAGGIASLLSINIAAALPAGFANLVGGSALLDSLGGAARTATAAAGQTARVTTSAARAIGDTGQRAAAVSLNWLYWLIPLLAIVALLIYFFVKPAEQVAQQGATAVQGLTVGGLDIGKQVTDSFTNLRTTLAGITDASSAQAAPKLREVTAQIDKVDGLLGQLLPEQRKVLAGVVNPLMPSLNQLFDKVLAIPGVAELLKPTIDALRAKLPLLTA